MLVPQSMCQSSRDVDRHPELQHPLTPGVILMRCNLFRLSWLNMNV